MLQYLHPDRGLPVQQRALLSEVPGKGSDLPAAAWWECIQAAAGTTALVFSLADLVITLLKAYLLKLAEI